MITLWGNAAYKAMKSSGPCPYNPVNVRKLLGCCRALANKAVFTIVGRYDCFAKVDSTYNIIYNKHMEVLRGLIKGYGGRVLTANDLLPDWVLAGTLDRRLCTVEKNQLPEQIWLARGFDKTFPQGTTMGMSHVHEPILYPYGCP